MTVASIILSPKMKRVFRRIFHSIIALGKSYVDTTVGMAFLPSADARRPDTQKRVPTSENMPTYNEKWVMSEKQFPQRKSPRLRGYDYSQEGAYFVTLCTHNRSSLFGDVINGEMLLSSVGEIAQQEIEKIPEYWSRLVDIDMAVVMPNHVHIIVILVGTAFLPSASLPSENTSSASYTGATVGTTFLPSTDAQKPDTQKRVPTLGNVIGNYKAGVTRLARRYMGDDCSIWQKRYHDHIIRNEESLNKIREYALYNPARWQDDTFYSST